MIYYIYLYEDLFRSKQDTDATRKKKALLYQII